MAFGQMGPASNSMPKSFLSSQSMKAPLLGKISSEINEILSKFSLIVKNNLSNKLKNVDIKSFNSIAQKSTNKTNEPIVFFNGRQIFNLNHLKMTDTAICQISHIQKRFLHSKKFQIPKSNISNLFKSTQEIQPGLQELINNETNPAFKAKIIDSFVQGHKYGAGSSSGSRISPSDKVILFLLKFGLFGVVLYTLSGRSEVSTTKSLLSMNESDFIKSEASSTTFNEVCAIDEAKMELQEIVNYLVEPTKYTALGAKLPKGVLLYGPPGNGKTLLAKAISGEAGVPFFHVSGSQFDEQFVGTGAKRIRELFDKAKKNAPCVVFIDEIDSVGAKRTSADIYPYANQTINQLLSELDGFSENSGVIVIGATNRIDNLDRALLRPGRFDIEVFIGYPDKHGRKQLLKHYLEKIIASDDVSIDELSKLTRGFSGAKIANLINQAALRAAFHSKVSVSKSDLGYALDKILMGLEKPLTSTSEEEIWQTAIHEAGHGLAAHILGSKIVRKLTILPRGQSLGHTSYLHEKDGNLTKADLYHDIMVAFAGRAAEHIIFDSESSTTGCHSDIKYGNKLAEDLVNELAMDPGNRIRIPESRNNEVVVENISNSCYEAIFEVLKKNKDLLISVAQCLMQYETLDREQFIKVIERSGGFTLGDSEKEIIKKAITNKNEEKT